MRMASLRTGRSLQVLERSRAHLQCQCQHLTDLFIWSLCVLNTGARDAAQFAQQKEYDIVLDEEITDRFVIAHTMGGEGDEDEGVRWLLRHLDP